jgi:hypothetical protein
VKPRTSLATARESWRLAVSLSLLKWLDGADFLDDHGKSLQGGRQLLQKLGGPFHHQDKNAGSAAALPGCDADYSRNGQQAISMLLADGFDARFRAPGFLLLRGFNLSAARN